MIVGISGLSGSGKDSVADLLVSKHGAVKIALADPIKRICADVFGWDVNTLWGPSARRNALDLNYPRKHTWKEGVCACCSFDVGAPETKDREIPEECFCSPRYALQRLGSEWARDCYPNVWIDYAVRVAGMLRDGNWAYTQQKGLACQHGFPSRDVCVPDVRFKNEVDGLKKAGAKLVRVRRVGYEKPRFDHPSETEQMGIQDSEFDFVLENDGTLEQLAAGVDYMWKELSK